MSHKFANVGKPELLSHTVEAEIESAIRERRLVLGARLPSEFELCEQFGVSRTVMREALRMLSARGLVRIEKGRGIFVSEPSAAKVTDSMSMYLHMNRGPEHALDVVRARQLIEPVIAGEAALRHTAADAAQLRANHETLCACERPYTRLTALDMEFHCLVAEATHNPVLPLLIDPIHQLMPRIKEGVYEVVADAHESAMEWHGAILKAILGRDREAACERMREHLAVAEEHVRAMLAHSAAVAA